ncbi:hypothetical protein COV56_03075 [Candidatus Kuenenbacteria bacterium CG11_big_fil_rev_8_21_14_0_20_37_9]|uniref:Uncharacterized protein n=2 Tax=Candidatus Kueneniibacteriota TaxID=1752740 RepID=A0A2M6XSE4_9BACT|nr:MAG: hypothetical protein AUJ29_03200 [Candidatus Kuenenbacteria bacterium CG1_02_38_13]PIR05384.1 MAG: hypothetical protein COV56_03075 [Candidatus Kuenenbacteria bacterium CG11_big_fil_rev_8_21_14_0_20_37_9]PIU10565.1 MAG: hypothetical protein COT27_02440 [Candidatus Kuenenbacteria bacterium CG08_land_8_20_14_0_20_37_23]
MLFKKLLIINWIFYMNKKNISFVSIVVLLAIGAGCLPASANYNSVTWGTDTTLFFPGVAATTGAVQGISINASANSFINDYIADVASLRIEMYPNSEIHLRSADRKIFTADIETAETVCYEDYSTFDYATPESYATFTITFTDGGNCPTTEVVVDTSEETPSAGDNQKIDLLELIGVKKAANLKVDDQVSFYSKGIMEIITVRSMASTNVKVELQKLNKELTLIIGKIKNIDIDADNYRDASLEISGLAGGKFDLKITPINKIEVSGVLPGDLIKIADSKVVYYFGADSRRYIFPNEKIFMSWYSDFSGVKTVSVADMAKIPLGSLITYKPGVKMVKFTTNPDVYVIARGGEFRKLRDEAMAKNLFGADWNKKIDDINDAFYSSYVFGKTLIAEAEYNVEMCQAQSPTISVDRDI